MKIFKCHFSIDFCLPEQGFILSVLAADNYAKACKDNKIDVVNGFFFRPLDARTRLEVLNSPFSSSSATKRLRLYLKDAPFDSSAFTAHGFRAGCAITLLLNCSPDEVQSHCRWASDRVFAHYTKLDKISRLEVSAVGLREGVSGSHKNLEADSAAAFYRRLNSVSSPSRAF